MTTRDPENLAAFCGLFGDLQFKPSRERERPVRESVRAVSAGLERALLSESFVVDCATRELERMERSNVLGHMNPFFVAPELDIRFSFLYWAPGEGSRPHEHTDWTVTAVCQNELQVEVFDWRSAVEEAKVVRTRVHPASDGRAGYIYDPCVHNPRNLTNRWSMSIHIVSPHDGKPLDGRTPFAAPPPPSRLAEGAVAANEAFTRCYDDWRRECRLRVLVGLLDTRGGLQATPLLERLFERGRATTRRMAMAALARRDSGRAQRLLQSGKGRRITAASRLTSATPRVVCEVREQAGSAELVVNWPYGSARLVRTDPCATEALRVLATEPSVVVGDLPGPLSDAERVALAEAVDEWFLFDLEAAA